MEGFCRRRVGQEVISKRKDCFQQSHIPLGGKAGVLLGGLPHLPMVGGGMERAHVTSLVLLRNFLIDRSRLHV